ncbi:ABC transporter ATP-binding protein [Microbacterium sp. Marseille-Q6965]|uniref:ABC transporter ATP-binding protein n=1 Tax=Microbacterium sp. Marseille-Q6965 TaxID=2965072 RepID=UPI0021B6E9BF|nr:ABC transporter ATP-binding protein [Microbacterium sp. Marseille-Q6965]
MADGKVLEFTGVTKVFGDVAAVSDLTARIEPGSVTAFLGPNGAGKTTTLRILLGQLKPSSGQATIGGVPYARIPSPARTVGWVGEAEMAYRPRRTAVRHLTGVAKSAGVPVARVREVLDLVGLADVADMRIGGYSLGMRQRLSVAQALLGDPGVLVFDEPANGLDPEGIRWMRLLMRSLADEGRTVLMSSHLLSEVQQIADRVLIMSNGNLVFNGGIEQLAEVEAPVVAVDSPDRAALSTLLRERGFDCEVLRSGLNVRGASAEEIGRLAASAGIALSTLHQRTPSLEDVFLDLVSGRRSQQTAALGAPTAAAATPDAVPAVEERILTPDAGDEETGTAHETGAAPTGDPDAETDLATAAGLGDAASVTGLAGAAATAFAADATTLDPEPLPGTHTLEEQAADTPSDPPADGTDEEESGASDAAALFAEVLAAVQRESDEPEGPEDDEPEGTEDAEPAGAEDAEAAADVPGTGVEDGGDSPWSVGPSFADRLGEAAEAPAREEPFDAEFVPSYLLETQAMDVIPEEEGTASDEVIEAELIEGPDGDAADAGLGAEDATGTDDADRSTQPEQPERRD